MSTAPEWDRAQVLRLARRLGYALVWPPEDSSLALFDVVISADVDAVLAPASGHFDTLMLDRLMHVVSIETACPRLSFDRWFQAGGRR
ncbi:hypothetical protein [Nocardia vermiculata]|uniref:hypothetical protein n=1 Tax=Nocardia vermiculata TaxID=257274 RepID=UPI001FE08781|nr:hypothetical protein [Nocardia vermiculata]